MLNPEKRKESNRESRTDRRLTPEEMRSFIAEIEALPHILDKMVTTEGWWPKLDKKEGERTGRLSIYDREGKLMVFEDGEAIRKCLEKRRKQVEKGLGLIPE